MLLELAYTQEIYGKAIISPFRKELRLIQDNFMSSFKDKCLKNTCTKWVLCAHNINFQCKSSSSYSSFVLILPKSYGIYQLLPKHGETQNYEHCPKDEAGQILPSLVKAAW